MELELQLRRTPGTVCGEIMRDSGVTLPNGNYIARSGFVLELINGDAQLDRTQLRRQFIDSIDYGTRDNIWTGVQLIQLVCERLGGMGEYTTNASTYTFNPWKELMGGNKAEAMLGVDPPLLVVKALRTIQENPREGVRIFRDLYALFVEKLPQSLQEEFLRIVGSYPCEVDSAIGRNKYTDMMFLTFPDKRQIYDSVSDIVSRIAKATPKGYKHDMRHALKLIADHNICVGKGELIKHQIEDLLGHDLATIPEHWREGHLDERVIAEKREELEELLQKRRT